MPVITDQVTEISKTPPTDSTASSATAGCATSTAATTSSTRSSDDVSDGKFVSGSSAGCSGIGLAVLSVVLNSFVVTVLTLYFLASLDRTKHAFYGLAPASRRDRVTKLGDEIIKRVGGYVSGAFIVALCAGISSLVFLFVVGLGKYAVALAFVVALLDVIPMIGATIGAVIVTAIGFATDPKIGLICIVFYVVYQQLENYVIYPRVMSKSVDVPGAVTVIAALIGATLLGVVGALLAIPTAAAILMLTREVFLQAPGRALAIPEPRSPLAELDRDHAGQDQHATGHLDQPRHLAEQQPGGDQGDQHLGQRHERRQPRPEPAGRRDAGAVGQGRGHHAERQHRQPPRHGDRVEGDRPGGRGAA